MDKLGYTIAEACNAAGFGRRFCYEAIADGRLDARKLGRRTIITADSLHRYIENLPTAHIKMSPRQRHQSQNTSASGSEVTDVAR